MPFYCKIFVFESFLPVLNRFQLSFVPISLLLSPSLSRLSVSMLLNTIVIAFSVDHVDYSFLLKTNTFYLAPRTWFLFSSLTSLADYSLLALIVSPQLPRFKYSRVPLCLHTFLRSLTFHLIWIPMQ